MLYPVFLKIFRFLRHPTAVKSVPCSDIDDWAEKHGSRNGTRKEGSDYGDLGMWGKRKKTILPEGKYCHAFQCFIEFLCRTS